MSNCRSKIRIAIILTSALFLSLALRSHVHADPADDENQGRYNLVYDSTGIWPDGKGGYDYTRKFISEVTLAEKGRSALSRPATPILGKNDEITISAYTKLPSGEILKADVSDMVTRDLPGGRRWIFINFRQAEPGAVLHQEWRLISKEADIAGKRFLGRTVPVDSSVIIITVPESWMFNFAVDPGVSELEKKSIMSSPENPARSSYIWIAKHLPSLSHEEFAPPVERLIPCVYFSFNNDTGWKSPDSTLVNWKYLADLYYGQIVNYTKPSGSLDAVADSLKKLSSQNTLLARMAYIWLSKHFQSVYNEATLLGNVDEALERGRGSQAEASAILYLLFQKLKIPSKPFLVATHNVGDPLINVPGLFWFDRLLLQVSTSNDTLWIDPNYQIAEMGVVPFEDQGSRALNVGEGGGSFTNIPSPDYRDNGRAIHFTLDIDSIGGIHGDITEIYSGAMVSEVSTYLKSIDEDEGKIPWEKNLAKSFPGVTLSRFIAITPDSAGGTYKIGYSFTTGPIIRPSAKRAYIPMDLLGRWSDLPELPGGARQFPIEIRRPRFELERMTLNIAPPYETEYLPNNYSQDDNIGQLFSVARGDKHEIIVTRGFGLKKSVLPLTEYNSFRKFINRARFEADKHIILKKAG